MALNPWKFTSTISEEPKNEQWRRGKDRLCQIPMPQDKASVARATPLDSRMGFPFGEREKQILSLPAARGEMIVSRLGDRWPLFRVLNKPHG